MPRHQHPDRDPDLRPVPVAVILPRLNPTRRLQPPTSPPTGRARLSADTVALLIATYSQAGDLIVTPPGDTTTATIAMLLGRHTTGRLTHRDRNDVRRVFWQPAPSPAQQPPLILELDPATQPRAGAVARFVDWMRVRRDALAPRGFLLVALHAPADPGAFVDQATALITAARTVGLIYHQHLVVVHTPLAEPAGDGERAIAPRLVGGRHARVHTDLYAFTSGDFDV